MSPATFARRLEDGESNHLIYRRDEYDGLVSIWMYEGSFILTWEECPIGEQYDESTYSRDERHVFLNIEEVLGFLTRNGLKAESFAP